MKTLLAVLVVVSLAGCGDPPVIKRHKEIIERLDNIEKAIKNR